VVGYPDEKFGERACAFVQVYPGVQLDLERLAPFLLAAGLSKEKLPELVISITDMPRSPDGKPLKGQLRDRLAQTS
jgi:cyclohexanecarboxylate-CoA ligase